MSDRTFERAVRDWLDDGSDRTPRHAIDAVLLAVKTTPQERDLRLPRLAWRPRTMFDRLAVAAVAAVVAIGSFTIGSTLLFKPSEPAAGACPTPFSEADAIDTSVPGLSQTDRAWGIEGGTPSRVRPGVIAAFDPVVPFDPDRPGAQLSVITIDPATGTRCRLATFAGNRIIWEHLSQLDWSPSGDALAIALDNPGGEGDAIGETGEVWIWTASRLARVWSGPGQQPGVEWAPDGRSIAVWMDSGGDSTLQVIAADGSATQDVNLRPRGVNWSPDGTRLLVREITDEATTFHRSHLSVVNVADGRVTPIDPGIAWFRLVSWIDDDHVLLEIPASGSDRAFVNVSLASPDRYSTLPVPPSVGNSSVALAPDGHHIAYVTPGGRNRDGEGGGGDLEIADLAAPESTPVHVVTGGGFSPGLAWAPDGSQVVFTRYVGDEGCCSATTWIVNADGTNLREIATGNTWTMDSPWQPVPVR